MVNMLCKNSRPIRAEVEGTAEVSRTVDSGLVCGDEVPQLFDHSVDELLFVALILTELRKHVVFPTSVFHPKVREIRKQMRNLSFMLVNPT